MHIDYAFICDFAEARDKVNAIGIGFDKIYAQRMPARHPHFSVVVQIRFNRTETGTKDVQVHLTDEDGSDVVPTVNSQLVVSQPPSGTLESITRIVMEFGNVEFKKYGDYSVRINIATQEVVSIPMTIAQPPRTG